MAKCVGVFMLLFRAVFGMQSQQTIITSDIENFWTAYDKITNTKDSIERVRLINDLYISKASEGLKGLMYVRSYEDHEFVEAILRYPKYWNSIRERSLNALKDATQIEANIHKLHELYPALKPANVYFSIGVFRSGGTYHNGNVLLGGEILFADKEAALDELPERVRNSIKEYAPYDIPLMATHEYIHTQQKSWEYGSILHRCVAEGVAEFISTLVTNKPLSPAVAYGKEHPEEVLSTFMKEIMRDDDLGNWLWSANQNKLRVNDLGYYIGYQICELYYGKAQDKRQAIKNLIELDYNNNDEFAALVDGTGFLPMTITEISNTYESLRPVIKRITEFENGSDKVTPNLKTITVEFAQPMSECCRSFDLGTSADAQPIKISEIIGWTDEGRKFSFAIEELKPNTHYELIISNFAKKDGGNRLAPYLIEFRTANG